MQHRIHQLLTILLMIMLGVGCGPTVQEPIIPLEEVQSAVQQARASFEALSNLPIGQAYQEKFQEVKDGLVNAETNLQANLLDEAYTSALTSLTASQHILKQFYQDTIARSAQDAKAEIEAITEEDPGNPLEDFLPKLDEILTYSEEIGNQPQVDVTKLLDDLKQVQNITYNTESTFRQTLESDVSFESGKYELSDKGKRILETYCQEILAAKNEYHQRYPDKLVMIKIRVVGYTDRVGFLEGTSLIKKLIEHVEDQVPQTQPEKRQFFNQRLSEFRAKTISAYMVQFIEQADHTNSQFQIDQTSIGLGEELPPGVSSPPYSISDPQRRICKIYVYIIA